MLSGELRRVDPEAHLAPFQTFVTRPNTEKQVGGRTLRA